MNFTEIAQARQSCRAYDPEREVESGKLEAILAAARLSPSACNGQPYHITVCRGEAAREAASAAQGRGMNKFATDAPIVLVISEEPYVESAAFGARVLDNDYRSIDIGIMTAHLTLEAAAQGLGTCILGWFDDTRVRKITGREGKTRLLVTLGYPKAGDPQRPKKRKDTDELVSYVG